MPRPCDLGRGAASLNQAMSAVRRLETACFASMRRRARTVTLPIPSGVAFVGRGYFLAVSQKHARYLRQAALSIAVCTLGVLPVVAAMPSDRRVTPSLEGNRILIVTTTHEGGRALADVLSELYGADVAVETSAAYSPWIDEHSSDGIVYLGADYYARPKPGFLADVRRTRKPVLWLGYHAWLLGDDFLMSKGLVIHDRYTSLMTSVALDPPVSIPPTEATAVESLGAPVLFWLTDARDTRTPGALHGGNLTYLSYVPRVDLYAAEFAPLLMTMRDAFGRARPPRIPRRPDYATRIEAARRDTFRTGIHLPVYAARTTDHSVGYDAEQWHANLVRIKRSGAEWVNIVRTYQMADVKASVVEADPVLTPTLESLADITADAHKVGLLVRLHMAVNLIGHRPNEWHGMISPADRRRWWASYDARVRELAEFATTHEIESLMLGTEFTSMQHDVADWRRLIAMLRDEVKYPGLIGYGVNFNSLNVEWLDALDFFGISAYWPLAADRDPDLDTLMHSWDEIDTTLRRWKAAHSRVPLELGEIGYVSQPYASVLPFSWKSHKGDQQSLTEQLRCYESVLRFLTTATYVSGVHFFASTAEDLEPGSRGYTPFGKPAERVMNAIMAMR